MNLTKLDMNNTGGASLDAVERALAPVLAANSRDFQDMLSRMQDPNLSPQDLLTLQTNVAHLNMTTQLQSELLKSVKDLNSSVLKNLQ